MSKIAEQKAKDIAKKLEESQAYKFDNFSVVCGAIEGYDQAMKDFMEKAERYLRYRVYYNTHPNNINVAIENFKNYMQNE